MELRAPAHEGRPNPAFTIPGPTTEVYLTQMLLSLRHQVAGIAASTATSLTPSLCKNQPQRVIRARKVTLLYLTPQIIPRKSQRRENRPSLIVPRLLQPLSYRDQ